MREHPNGVLITRHATAAAETARHVTARGYVPVIAPMLDIVPHLVDLPPPRGLQAILVTSPNAPPVLPSVFHAVPVFAVGDATAAAARNCGFWDVQSAGSDAVALATLVTASCNAAAGALLLASGEGQGGALCATLQAAGFRMIHRAVYSARPATVLPAEAQTALAEATLAAALFFSPATARAFVAVLDAAFPRSIVKGIDAMVISDATREPLAPLPWRSIRVASRPNLDEMLALLT